MKTKYLFGMLLSGTMLAACTADDLNTAPVSQEVNPSAPVFNVTIEDNGIQNRGTYQMDGHKLSWTTDDLMSLFHGATAVSSLAETQNAVYYGEQVGDGQFDFKTAAMVQPGYAVMVYPADVAFRNQTTNNNVLAGKPVIMVSADQNSTTKDSTAYISEVLQLVKNRPETTKDAQDAGYGYNYDIVLKRAVGTLHMPLKTTNAPVISGIDPIKITSVKITSTANSFATQGTIESESTTEYASGKSYWKGKSEVVADKTTAVTAITSTDLTETNDTVAFTFLPEAATLTNSTIEVHTTYGVVTIADVNKTTNTGVWVNTTMKDKDLTNGLEFIMENLFDDNKDNGSFKKSWYGKFQTVGLNVDLSKAKLNGMHIKTSEELNTVLKVFDYNSAQSDGEKVVTLYLDGDEDGRFTIEDNETWKSMKDHMAAATTAKGVTFVPCNTQDEKCEIVRLVNDDDTDAQEVPSLLFSDNEVVVELEGLWSYDGQDDDPATTNVDERKAFTSVINLTVVEGAELTLNNQIVASDNNEQYSNINLENYGKVKVPGMADVGLNMTNWNKIEIAKDGKLGVIKGKTLTNKAAQPTGDHQEGVTGWDEGAVIDNYGWLAVKGTENGKVNNYGVINSYVGARTLVTNNSRDNVSTGQPYSSGKNAIGTINVFQPEKKADNNVVVDNKTFKGFIKLKVTKDNAEYDDFGDVANYVEISGDCANLTVGTIDEVDYMPSQVKYIEITSSKEVKLNGTFNIAGLYIKPGASANIPEGATVTVSTELYLKGLLSVGGKLVKTNATFTGYHGGSESDANNIYRTGGTIQ